jgi:hypothetical protein
MNNVGKKKKRQALKQRMGGRGKRRGIEKVKATASWEKKEERGAVEVAMWVMARCLSLWYGPSVHLWFKMSTLFGSTLFGVGHPWEADLSYCGPLNLGVSCVHCTKRVGHCI